MTNRCPQCQSPNVSGLMAAFWVDLNEDGEADGDWADYEGETEVGDDRLCRDCGHEWED